MATAINITLDDAQVARALDRLITAGSNLFPLMDEIGGQLVANTQERFEQGVDPDGAPWKPSKRALAQGGQTLVDKGFLRDSVQHRAGADEVEVGSNLVIAAIHQLGGLPAMAPGPAAIPARPYLGIGLQDRADIGAIVTDYLRGAGV